MMDTAWHNWRVAEAATAWLTEPRDAQAYARMVEAIAARSQHLAPTIDGADPVPASRTVPETLARMRESGDTG